MFKNVLVGVDGRQGGRDAIALASQLVASGGKLTVVCVFGGAFMPPHTVTPEMIEDGRAQARAQLERDQAETGVEAELVIAEGLTAGRVLHERAERQRADLLVLGSCHRGAFGRAMLGDDTRESLNGAPCAVAIAPAGYSESAKPFATIGVGYDGSPESRAALALARALGERTGARVSALKIVHFPTYIYSGLMPPPGVDR